MKRILRTIIVIQQKAECEPFLFDDISRNDPTEFQVYFCQGKSEYRYYLALKEDEVVSEALYWRTIGGKKTGTVFEREGAEITLGASINKASINKSVSSTAEMPRLSLMTK